MNTIYTDAPEVRALAAIAFPGYSGKRFRAGLYWQGVAQEQWSDNGCRPQCHWKRADAKSQGAGF